MAHVTRLLVVVLAVSVVAPAGTVAGVAGDHVDRDPIGFGQAVDRTTDDARTLIDHVATQETSSRVLTVVTDRPRPVLPVGPAGLLAGYSRVEESDPLDDGTRRALHDAVVSAPGLSVTTAARDVEVPVSTARYHLRVLEDADLLERHRYGGHARLYPAGFGGDAELVAAMATPAAASVVAAVASTEPVSVSALAAETDLATSTASHHVTRLTDAGALERERVGKTVRVSLSEAATRLLGDAPDGVASTE